MVVVGRIFPSRLSAIQTCPLLDCLTTIRNHIPPNLLLLSPGGLPLECCVRATTLRSSGDFEAGGHHSPSGYIRRCITAFLYPYMFVARPQQTRFFRLRLGCAEILPLSPYHLSPERRVTRLLCHLSTIRQQHFILIQIGLVTGLPLITKSNIPGRLPAQMAAI